MKGAKEIGIIIDFDRTIADTSKFDGTRWDKEEDKSVILNNLECVRIYPGVKEVIGKLNKYNIGVSIVTKRHREYLKIMIDFLKIPLDINLAVCYDDIYHQRKIRVKPSPEQYELAKQKLLKNGYIFDDSLIYCIGDDIDDIRAARSPQMIAIGALWGAKNDIRNEKAIICNNICEVWSQVIYPEMEKIVNSRGL